MSGVLPGSCVAFADPSGEEGAVIVAVESDGEADGDDGLGARVRAGITNAIGITPREVLIVEPGMIPKAANGKLQRLAARDAYAAGRARSLTPSAAGEPRSRAEAVDPGRVGEVERVVGPLLHVVAALLRAGGHGGVG